MWLFGQTLISASQSRAWSKPQPAEATGRITAIDGMRALAMLMVYLYHTWEFAGAPAGKGSDGIGHSS